MRTIEEILADLRALAAKAATGQNVSNERATLERELGQHGIRVQTGDAPPAAPRGGSRFAGQGADPAVARALAAGQGLTPEQVAGRRVAEPRNADGLSIRSGIDLLLAVKGARSGDLDAQRQMAGVARFQSEAEKALTGGAYMVQQDLIPGYVEALAANNPLRALATEHDVTGREVRMLFEGDDLLVTEHVPEGGTKPSSDMSMVQTVSTIFKAAGVTELPDELIDDTGGEAADMVGANFARSIGRTVDLALLSGTGTGQPLGILAHGSVDHVTASGQQAVAVYRDIIRRITVLKGRLLTDLTVVLHPAILERFDLAVNSNGDYLFPNGLADKLVGKAAIVEDANMPVVTGNNVPIVVGAFKRGLHFFSRKAIVVEQSNGPGFVSDETTFRAVERYGAVVAKPSCFEVIDGLNLDYVEGL